MASANAAAEANADSETQPGANAATDPTDPSAHTPPDPTTQPAAGTTPDARTDNRHASPGAGGTAGQRAHFANPGRRRCQPGLAGGRSTDR